MLTVRIAVPQPGLAHGKEDLATPAGIGNGKGLGSIVERRDCNRGRTEGPCGDDGWASAGDVFAFGTENDHPFLGGGAGDAGRDVV